MTQDRIFRIARELYLDAPHRQEPWRSADRTQEVNERANNSESDECF